MLKEHISSVHYKNVVIDAVSEGKVRVQFTVDSLELKKIICTNDADVVFSTEWQIDTGPVLPDSVRVVVPLDEVTRPKYCAAMGDAAQAYCDAMVVDGTYYEKFRWNEVWDRMWAAREK